jgi:hypothetical protein
MGASSTASARVSDSTAPQMLAATAQPEPGDLFPAEETLLMYEMQGDPLAHANRVPVKVPLATGEVFGYILEKSS